MDEPVTDNGEVVLDALVVDVGLGLEEGHGDLSGPDRLRDSRHSGDCSLYSAACCC